MLNKAANGVENLLDSQAILGPIDDIGLCIQLQQKNNNNKKWAFFEIKWQKSHK